MYEVISHKKKKKLKKSFKCCSSPVWLQQNKVKSVLEFNFDNYEIFFVDAYKRPGFVE
jgi:hypothetical protein